MAKVSVQHLQIIDAVGTDTGDVAGIDLEIADREFLLISGPAGCGKSALLRAIAGLDKISKGNVFIGDRRVTDLRPIERDVAMVFQTDALYPRMSVYENLAFGLRARKFSKSEIKKRVDDGAEVLGIKDLLNRRPHELTAIDRGRVAIARAAVRRPKVILFDEPLRGFDPAAHAQMRAIITRLREHLQATFIYATRDSIDAMALGDRVAIMQNGAIEQVAPPAEIYDAPRNLFVTGFVGMPPMNFVNGTVKLDRDSIVFSESEGGTIQLRLTMSDRPALKEFAGQPILLGIRPEAMRIASTETGREEVRGEFPAIIELVERGGAETILHVQTSAHTLLARMPQRLDQVSARHRARFTFAVENVHFFDPATGVRIA